MFLNKSGGKCGLLALKGRNHKGFHLKINYQYNNLLGKPIDSLSINVLINADIVKN